MHRRFSTMHFLKKSILVLSYFSIVFGQGEIIRINNGLVQGAKISNHLYGFRGIPYAKPPIDELRFEPPHDPDNWEGIWNATYDRNHCVQILTDISLILQGLFTGNEDCLYINVYIPKLPTSNVLLPVMVWIYGGAFLFGNGNYDNYAPDYLVAENVIVVTFNYRLGIFGFLSTEDDAAPGNTGLRDQIHALKWVQNNIKAFGGNPNSVTIFGESAGSASVSYLTISPLAKGLFRSGIMQSGTTLCLWSLSRKARETAYLVGKKLGIVAVNSRDLVARLKKVPANVIQAASMIVMDMLLTIDPINGLIFAPVIEPPNENAVISSSSYDHLSRGDFNQVPTIIGYNSAEGMGFELLVKLLNMYVATYDLIPARLVPASMNIMPINIIELSKVGLEIKEHFAGKFGILSYPNDNFISYLSSDEFVRPIQKTAELMAKYSSVYLYKFSYTSDPNAKGAAHGDDLSFLFVSDHTTPSDIEIRNCMVKLWTNFAKYNNPTDSSDICSGNISWLPNNPKETEKIYLNIDRNTTTGENPDEADYRFWEYLFGKYGNPPYKTY